MEELGDIENGRIGLGFNKIKITFGGKGRKGVVIRKPYQVDVAEVMKKFTI